MAIAPSSSHRGRDPRRTQSGEIEPIQAPDGSSVRELAHPRSSAARNQSVAEATVAPGGSTVAHLHRRSEEIYHFVSGSGRLRLGDRELEVGPGDSVVIEPGVPHRLVNDGGAPLVLLCCCSPPYSDEDTILLGE